MPTPITDPNAIHVKHHEDDLWINPVGGLGDVLMISGVLKLVHDQFPDRRYKLVRRTKYSTFLKGHPAIDYIGYPPANSKNIITTDYWSDWPMGGGKDRAFQRLAARFGLETPVKEELYVPFEIEKDSFLERAVPWEAKNVLIAPFSDSPRKMMPFEAWERLVWLLKEDNYFVLQGGRSMEIPIRGAYSVLGATDPKQMLYLIKKCDLVITADNFVMHAAKLLDTPAVVLWGPTQRIVYGYENHSHIEAPLDHCEIKDKCLGPHVPENYSTPCPLEVEHCMNKIDPEKIYHLAVSKL
jgi:ADP-heptose:LPS heptosyltransferase